MFYTLLNYITNKFTNQTLPISRDDNKDKETENIDLNKNNDITFINNLCIHYYNNQDVEHGGENKVQFDLTQTN
jgi:hypothetical protein